jgi:hypothetical protein
MAAGMSEGDSAPQKYETIIIVGGGCYGGYYVRQLQRAARAGALSATALHVVDRDAACAVAAALSGESIDTPVPTSPGESLSSPIPTSVVVADWREYFTDYLTRAATDRDRYRSDAIVPSPLMPHLMAEWLVARAKERWSDRSVATAPIGDPMTVPWQRSGADGTHYVSFADWICPINCIEPRVCPETRGVRDWTLPPTVAAYAERAGAASAVMFCRHRAYGVGMFDTAEVTAADDVVRSLGDDGGEVLIGTTSHCHGALTRLVVGPRPGPSDSPNR